MSRKSFLNITLGSGFSSTFAKHLAGTGVRDLSDILCISPSGRIVTQVHRELFERSIIPPKIVNLYTEIDQDFLFTETSGEFDRFSRNTEIGEIKRRVVVSKIVREILSTKSNINLSISDISNFMDSFIEIENLMLSNALSKEDLVQTIGQHEPSMTEKWINSIDAFLQVLDKWQEYKDLHKHEVRIERLNRNLEFLCEWLPRLPYRAVYFLSPVGTNKMQIKVLQQISRLNNGAIVFQGAELATSAIKNVLHHLSATTQDITHIDSLEHSDPRNLSGGAVQEVETTQSYNIFLESRHIASRIQDMLRQKKQTHSSPKGCKIAVVTRNAESAQLITTFLRDSGPETGYFFCNSFGYEIKGNIYWRLYWRFTLSALGEASLFESLFILKYKGWVDSKRDNTDAKAKMDFTRALNEEFFIRSASSIASHEESLGYTLNTHKLDQISQGMVDKSINFTGENLGKAIDSMLVKYCQYFKFEEDELYTSSAGSLEFIKFIKELSVELSDIPFESTDLFISTLDSIASKRHYRPYDEKAMPIEADSVYILSIEEARLFSFDHLFITSLTESHIPMTSSENSIINSNLQKILGIQRETVSIEWHDFLLLIGSANRVTLSSYSNEISSSRISRVPSSPFLLRLRSFWPQVKFKDTDPLSGFVSRLPIPDPQTQPTVSISENQLPGRIYPSHIRTNLDNPYDFYVKYVLGLKPLNALQRSSSDADYGTVLHDALQAYSLSKNRKSGFVMHFVQKALQDMDDAAKLYEFLYHESLKKLTRKLEEDIEEASAKSYKVFVEVQKSSIMSNGITLCAKIDRFDIDQKNQNIRVIDYKLKRSCNLKDVFVKHPYVLHKIEDSEYALDQIAIESYLLSTLGEFKGYDFTKLYYFINLSSSEVYQGYGAEGTGVTAVNTQELQSSTGDVLLDTLGSSSIKKLDYNIRSSIRYFYQNSFSHFARFVTD